MGLISRVSSRTYRIQIFKQFEPRKNTREELEDQIVNFRKELATLQVAKVTNGGNKVNKIRVVRKNIAKTLTVLNQSQKQELQKFYRGKSFKPTDLKPRKTRALRRRLNKAEEGAKKLKQIRREQKTAVKKFALKA